MLDLDNDGYDFTNATNGVGFDLNIDGSSEQTAWTTAAADDAWLVFDRSGDDLINDGQELFGDYTFQTPSNNPNGFLALAEWDKVQNGGNADGQITSADAAYPFLRLWQDKNHNAVSEGTELYPLASRGVTAISLAYVESKFTDIHGNEFKFVSQCTVNGVSRTLYDVYLVTQ